MAKLGAGLPRSPLRFNVSKTIPQRMRLVAFGAALVFGYPAGSKSTAAELAEIRSQRIIHCEDIDDHRATVVTGVAITRDGRTIAAATDDHRVLVWDAVTGEL